MLSADRLLHQAMPALLLIGLLDATNPPIARGLMPVCTAAGIGWLAPDGTPTKPEPTGDSPCPHGWCTPRKPRPSG
jgi:hypothetical protein